MANGTAVTDKLVYSAHDYPNGVACRPWMRGALWSGAACPNGYASAGFPGNLPAVWKYYWGFIHDQNIAPIYIGEFGTLYSKARNGTTDLPQDRAWLRRTDASYTDHANPQGGLVKYLKDKPRINWSFWTLEPNSEPGGILGGCRNVDEGGGLWTATHWDKLSAIRPIMSPPQPILTSTCANNPN